MKSPWEKEPGTVIIRKDEVTEILPPKPKAAAKPTAVAPKPAEPAIPSEIDMAIEDTLGRLHSADAGDFEGSQITKPRNAHLGEILLSMTKLTREQLDEAVKLQKEGNGEELLGDVLVRKKFINEDDLVSALSMQLNLPTAKSLTKMEIDPDLVTRIPINFARKHCLVPIKKERGAITVAVANAADLSPIDDLRMLLQMDVRAVLAKKSEIIDTINRIYDRATKPHEELMEDLEDQGLTMDLEETQDLLDSEDEAPIIRLVNTLLFRAVKERASDIHIEPFERELAVRFRIDGVLYDIMKPPKRAQASISSRIKIMAQLDIAEKRVPQDGRIKIRIAGRDVDIRVSTLPTSHGERIVMRLLDTANVLLSLEDIGFNQRQLGLIAKIINKAHGIFLVTGPTGSGKTTTLYACLSRLNSKELNIITVEDPVEIQLQGVGQIQVNPKVDLTFANGLRSILRQDPDVIMVGEIRDKETAEIAIQASLTGHFVFSTLHTNDAASSVTRLVDMGVEPFLISNSLVAIMAQRLIRVLCKECRQPYVPSAEELKELNITPEALKGHTVYKGVGCPTCWNTGYRGRSGIYEILPIDDPIRALIIKGSDGNAIKRAAATRGMRSLRDDGAEKILAGVTTVEEVLRVTQEDMTIE